MYSLSPINEDEENVTSEPISNTSTSVFTAVASANACFNTYPEEEDIETNSIALDCLDLNNNTASTNSGLTSLSEGNSLTSTNSYFAQKESGFDSTTSLEDTEGTRLDSIATGNFTETTSQVKLLMRGNKLHYKQNITNFEYNLPPDYFTGIPVITTNPILRRTSPDGS